MTRYVEVETVVEMNRLEMFRSHGRHLVCDYGLLESALVQIQQSFDGKELYPTIAEKAARILFSLVQNHPFLDGNKRTAHLAFVVFLDINGMSIDGDVEEHFSTILSVASGQMSSADLTEWVRNRLKSRYGWD